MCSSFVSVLRGTVSGVRVRVFTEDRVRRIGGAGMMIACRVAREKGHELRAAQVPSFKTRVIVPRP